MHRCIGMRIVPLTAPFFFSICFAATCAAGEWGGSVKVSSDSLINHDHYTINYNENTYTELSMSYDTYRDLKFSGIVQLSDEEDRLSGLFASITGSEYTLVVETGKISGTIDTKSAIVHYPITDPSESFDFEYRQVALMSKQQHDGTGFVRGGIGYFEFTKPAVYDAGTSSIISKGYRYILDRSTKTQSVGGILEVTKMDMKSDVSDFYVMIRAVLGLARQTPSSDLTNEVDASSWYGLGLESGGDFGYRWAKRNDSFLYDAHLGYHFRAWANAIPYKDSSVTMDDFYLVRHGPFVKASVYF